MTRLPPEFPPSFASACGDDEFGIWADLTVNDVTQRFRWIEPGEFLMGSPENELDRSNVEGPQPRVRISQGYWLADTACTQAFWLAVVGGENPAHFNDDVQNPIEGVSWNEINDQWFASLNKVLPDQFEAILPSEAQWEYACRAGTETPFSFGASITLDDVNYVADDSLTGLRRDRTVPVKSLPPNSWGLYEMHGNVMEWCRDGRFHYIGVLGVLVDPEGKADGARTLRGGSWFHPTRYIRSAFRRAFNPELRRAFIGFRLVLRLRK